MSKKKHRHPDLLCRCMGIDHRTRCELQADAEDGLCARCRTHDCEHSPLGWYVRQTEEMTDAWVNGHITEGEYDQRMEVVRGRYLNKAEAEEIQA